MARLERIVARLPDAVRVHIEAWDGEPTFRVRTSYTMVAPKSLAKIVLAEDGVG